LRLGVQLWQVVGGAWVRTSQHVSFLVADKRFSSFVYFRLDLTLQLEPSAVLTADDIPRRRPAKFFYSAALAAPCVVTVTAMGGAQITALQWFGGDRVAGVALHDAAEGTSVRVAVAGLTSVFNGLVPGHVYMAGPNASVVLGSDSQAALIVGKAISTTELILAPLGKLGS
jgi:hypothetical protein